MKAFVRHSGIAAPLLEPNIDTDIIIPSREMKRVTKQGLGDGAFANRRYTLPGGREPNPDFVLNQPQYKGTTVLLGGPNFGCGSSREHAVWALVDLGIRAIIAPGYGHIFYNNCIANGLLPVVLPEGAVTRLAELTTTDPQAIPVEIDLKHCMINCADERFDFEIESANRDMLMQGLDRIDQTLQHGDSIEDFEARDRAARGWAYLQ